MTTKYITVIGAREHNLKNVDVQVPKDQLVVFTGVSGSGKSSLALDTIFAEGQRRYIESLSSYARQFLGTQAKPEVDQIDGLSPAIAISQKKPFHNPRSTVGTITEIYDYLRLLFARIGHPHCPKCGLEVKRQSVDEIVAEITALAKASSRKSRGLRLMVLAPVVKDKKGEYTALFENLKKQGFTRARVDGEILRVDGDFVLIKTNRHTIEAIIDRLTLTAKDLKSKENPVTLTRLRDAISQALTLTGGEVILTEVLDSSFEFPEVPKKTRDHLFSERFACPNCNLSLTEPEPRNFSFNSPHGACPVCDGLGTRLKVDATRVFNPRLSIAEGGILPLSGSTTKETWYRKLLETVALRYNIDLNLPIGKLSQTARQTLLYGTGDEKFLVHGRNRHGRLTQFRENFPGVVAEIERRYRDTESEYVHTSLENFMVSESCPRCRGTRLKDEALAVTISGQNIAEVSQMSIRDLIRWMAAFEKGTAGTARERIIAEPIQREILSRLEFLNSVGLAYLTLDRPAATLSGGEAQRIRLASQIGSGLSGVLYVLDEPSVGLHQRDMSKLITTLKNLRDLGNTVLVVEHDQQMIREADWVLDFGPGGGKWGGQVVAQGTPGQISQDPNSLTGQYLSGQKRVAIQTESDLITESDSQPPAKKSKNPELLLIGAREHNLKNIDVTFPLGKFVCVTGVSGSGKSSLVLETLCPSLRKELGLRTNQPAGDHDGLLGAQFIDKIYEIDQSPIGQTPRSNPATYVGAFDYIREAFARTKEARLRGFTASHFSFNTKGGRCEACQGQGHEKIEMQFLPDIYVTCEVCGGARYNHEALEILYHDKSIKEVLAMTVDEALNFLDRIPPLARRLETLSDVGLGYIELGQPAPTLSGGEAQRVRLAKELSKKPKEHTFYVLDEPTIGLHPDDLNKLLNVLHRLVTRGNTVLVIEHNLDVIRNADWIIDLGPEGGDQGGEVVFAGTPVDLRRDVKSYTGQALKSYA